MPQEFDAPFTRVLVINLLDEADAFAIAIADHERRTLGRPAAPAERFFEFDRAAGQERVPVHSSSNRSHDAGSAPRWVLPFSAHGKFVRSQLAAPLPIRRKNDFLPSRMSFIVILQGWSGNWKCRGSRSKSSWGGWRRWPITSTRKFWIPGRGCSTGWRSCRKSRSSGGWSVSVSFSIFFFFYKIALFLDLEIEIDIKLIR